MTIKTVVKAGSQLPFEGKRLYIWPLLKLSHWIALKEIGSSSDPFFCMVNPEIFSFRRRRARAVHLCAKTGCQHLY